MTPIPRFPIRNRKLQAIHFTTRTPRNRRVPFFQHSRPRYTFGFYSSRLKVEKVVPIREGGTAKETYPIKRQRDRISRVPRDAFPVRGRIRFADYVKIPRFGFQRERGRRFRGSLVPRLRNAEEGGRRELLFARSSLSSNRFAGAERDTPRNVLTNCNRFLDGRWKMKRASPAAPGRWEIAREFRRATMGS